MEQSNYGAKDLRDKRPKGIKTKGAKYLETKDLGAKDPMGY